VSTAVGLAVVAKASAVDENDKIRLGFIGVYNRATQGTAYLSAQRYHIIPEKSEQFQDPKLRIDELKDKNKGGNACAEFIGLRS
jgi:hypothetical protein